MNSKRILFVELLGGIGDLIIALPAIHALAQTYPKAELSVLTFAPGGELLADDPQVSRVLYADKNDAARAVQEVLDASHNPPFDLIVSDTNHSGIAEMLGAYSNTYGARTVTNLWRNPPDDVRVGERFVQLLHSDGIIGEADLTPHLFVSEAARRGAEERLEPLFRPLVFLCPEAGMKIKAWPPERFVTLGRCLQEACGASLVVIGLGEDAATVAKELNALHLVSDLRRLAAALTQGNLMVAADTGPARIAAAVGTPTLTLFGPSWAGRYGQALPHVNLQGYPTCPERIVTNFTEQACWYAGMCPLGLGFDTCLETLSVEAVFAEAKTFLEAT